MNKSSKKLYEAFLELNKNFQEKAVNHAIQYANSDDACEKAKFITYGVVVKELDRFGTIMCQRLNAIEDEAAKEVSDDDKVNKA